MRVIHWKKKNIFNCLFFIIFIVGGYKFSIFVTTTRWYDHWFGDDTSGLCTKHPRWTKPKDGLPLIGLLGAPGSGVEWVRYLVEQMTGIYTGSVHEDFPEYFEGEGKTHNVISVMTYDAEKLPNMHAGIMVYRGMRDTIRTSYAQNTAPDTFLEAPLETYYGPDWSRFAKYEANAWVDRYQGYLDTKRPLLVVNYDQISDRMQMKMQLLRISNFLHVPIFHSRVNCLVERGHEFELKPRPLRRGFQPFSLLSLEDSQRFAKMENLTEILVGKARDKYSPKLH